MNISTDVRIYLYFENVAFILPFTKKFTCVRMNLRHIQVLFKWNTIFLPRAHNVPIFQLCQYGTIFSAVVSSLPITGKDNMNRQSMHNTLKVTNTDQVASYGWYIQTGQSSAVTELSHPTQKPPHPSNLLFLQQIHRYSKIRNMSDNFPIFTDCTQNNSHNG